MLEMSKHIQPISHYLPHERIKTFLIKKNNQKKNKQKKKQDIEKTVTQI